MRGHQVFCHQSDPVGSIKITYINALHNGFQDIELEVDPVDGKILNIACRITKHHLDVVPVKVRRVNLEEGQQYSFCRMSKWGLTSKCATFHGSLTNLFCICVTPKDNVFFEEVRNPHSISFSLRRHQRSFKAPVNICHHQISTIGKNELWKST